jgi:hypothetical protein
MLDRGWRLSGANWCKGNGNRGGSGFAGIGQFVAALADTPHRHNVGAEPPRTVNKRGEGNPSGPNDPLRTGRLTRGSELRPSQQRAARRPIVAATPGELRPSQEAVSQPRSNPAPAGRQSAPPPGHGDRSGPRPALRASDVSDPQPHDTRGTPESPLENPGASLPAPARTPAAQHGAGVSVAQRPAERKLMRRVMDHCDGVIRQACKASSVPPEFLAALTANESGGNPHAMRFEPAVYRHLKAVAAGDASRYGSLKAPDLAAELEEVLHPKSPEYYARYLTSPFGRLHSPELAQAADEALREMATSWGFTQIMGFHMVGRRGTARDLLDPARHYRIAVELLAEFAEDYQLDLASEFAGLFRCWNTGQPHGKTTDPAYVEHGLLRLELYRQLAASTGPPEKGAAA